MEAANRGGKDVGGRSVGCNIELAQEQPPNPYLDRWITFQHVYVRKLILTKYSFGLTAMPGGFGTLDKVFETLTLIQTEKIAMFTLVFVGVEYWMPLLEFVCRRLLTENTIDAVDFERLVMTDSAKHAVKCLTDVATSKFGLKHDPHPRRRWYLWE